ncbi:hypothetical protein BGX34_011410 [Mortierella sp. NVP85]|nr:hypothetical protein BGX34_011410 [Mortierella sp. NVP85]
MDEAHVGSAVNGYLTKSFTFDGHPPLTKLVLAGISSLTGYQGDFAFEEIGDPYPQDLPFLYMRATMALMDALCAPMAYVTLKIVGQSTTTAIAAAILAVFDKQTLERSITQKSHSFSTAKKKSDCPWLIWLTMTSIGTSGVLSIKANGLLTFLIIGFLSAKDMFNLAATLLSMALWAKHFFVRKLFLVVLPVMVYLGVFQIHFSLQTHQPSSVTRFARAEYDLDPLSYPFRDTLVSSSTLHKERDYFNPDEGQHVDLQQQQDMSWPRGSKQQQVTGYEYPDLNTRRIISKALTVHEEKKLGMTVIPDKLRCLCHGPLEMNGDMNDWWVIEAVDGDQMQKISRKLDIPVKALETTFRLKHYSLGCYLHVTQDEIPKGLSGGLGRRELAYLKSAKLSPSTIWRITLNDLDYYRAETREIQQISLVANPMVWRTGFLGIIVFQGAHAVSLVRKKRGYIEQGSTQDFRRGLACASIFFTGWAILCLPYLVFLSEEVNRLTTHHYFPALYCSILLASTIAVFVQVLSSQPLKLAKPQLRQRPPVLEAHYPSKDDALPMDSLFMTPAQRPPQLWEMNEQKGQPTMYQRQQMQAVFEAMRKEDEEKKRRKEQETQGGETEQQDDGEDKEEEKGGGENNSGPEERESNDNGEREVHEDDKDKEAKRRLP